MKSVMPLYFAVAMAIFSTALNASKIDIDMDMDMEIASHPEINHNQQSLLTSCQALRDSKANGTISACRYYIDGFVDAAKAAQGMHAETLKESENQPLSYTERAYRARVGKVDERTQGTRISYFCVPQGEAKEQLIENVATHMESSMETAKQLKTNIYSALTAAYPCR